MAVYVLGKHKTPLMPCSERRAQILLERGCAPFTIRLVDRVSGDSQPLLLKLDPGSKQTGIGMVGKDKAPANAVSLIELKPRGAAIGKALKQRSVFGRRRSAKLRYLERRLDNRRRPEGWIAHQADTVTSTVAGIRRVAPIPSMVEELVRLDMQLIENPEISGSSTNKARLSGARFASTCSKSGAANVPTTATSMCRSILITSVQKQRCGSGRSSRHRIRPFRTNTAAAFNEVTALV
jgi:hypothetical protein